VQLNPYLTFNGQCAEAFKFYEKCLDGSPKLAEDPMTYAKHRKE